MLQFYDEYWQSCFEVLRSRVSDNEGVIGPEEFSSYFDNYFIYEYKELCSSAEYIVVHKGMVDAIGRDFIKGATSYLFPIFANEVFVILGADPVETKDWLHHYEAFEVDLNVPVKTAVGSAYAPSLYELLRYGEYDSVLQQISELSRDSLHDREKLIEFSFQAKDWQRLYALTYGDRNDIPFGQLVLHAYACVHLEIYDALYYKLLMQISTYTPRYDSVALRLIELASIDIKCFDAIRVNIQVGDFIKKHFLTQKLNWPQQLAGPSSVSDEPIDAVYTWFDPTDPEWDRLRQEHLRNEDNELSGQARFGNIGEIYTSIDLLVQHLPFLRHVFIVSSGHERFFRSELLSEEAKRKITFVSHSQIRMPAVELPTFNSDAIESCLHRIPDLSDTFIYMNDDCFVAAPLAKRDLYCADGRPRILANAKIWRKEDLRVRGDSVADRDSRTLACFLERFGSPPKFVPAHQLMICSKKSFERTWEIYPSELAQYVGSRQMRDYDSLRFILLTAWIAEREKRQALTVIPSHKEIYRVGITEDVVATALSNDVVFYCLNNMNNQSKPLFEQFCQNLRHRADRGFAGPWL